ncbi:MAG: hypothetical protein LAQ30_04245 [Acidobacteriia bacterium]|nr:hypothetical protein [Terriglobia bacterium]
MREGAQIDVALALEKPLGPSGAAPEQTQKHADESRLDISVVFTSVRPTVLALKQAGALARPLAARITLVVPQIVPYPLPLESPPVLLDFNERRFFTIASESHVDTTVRIYLCRDQWEALRRILAPRSLVVLGGRKRWWPAAEARLAKRLRRIGHEVVIVETE